MSPKSRGRKKKHDAKPSTRDGGRTAAGRWHGDLAAELAISMGETFEDAAGEGSDPLGAELIGATSLATMIRPWAAEQDLDPLAELVGACARVATPQALATVLILAELMPHEGPRRYAAEVARRLAEDVDPPPWAPALSTAVIESCWQLSDVYGDQATVVCEFSRGRLSDGVLNHGAMYLLEFNGPGPWVMDLAVPETPEGAKADLRKMAAESDGALRFDQLPTDQAHDMLQAAMTASATDVERDLDLREGFAAYWPLGLARLRSFGGTELAGDNDDDAQFSPDELERLVEEFCDSDVAAAAAVSEEPRRRWAALIARYGNEKDGGRPLRVGPGKTEAILLEEFPEEVEEDRAALGPVLRAWNAWAGQRQELPKGAVDELLEITDELVEAIIGDPDWHLAGPGTARPVATGDEMNKAYQVRVDLVGAKPPIWRRLMLPGAMTLEDVHKVLQDAFGWVGGHLHDFTIEPPSLMAPWRFGDPSMTDDVEDEATTLLGDVISKVGDRLEYEYDFGDSWRHRIVVEEVTHSDTPTVRCLGGRRAGPPEDCGGIWSYNEMAEAWSDEEHPMAEVAEEWLTGDPADFDKDLLDEYLRQAFPG